MWDVFANQNEKFDSFVSHSLLSLGTPLSNSIESQSEAPEEFTTSQGTPLDFTYSSLDLENSRLDLANSSNDDTKDKSTSITSLEISLEGKFQKWWQNLYKTLIRFDCWTLDDSKFYLKG